MVLDSSAIVAIFRQEAGHRVLEQKIDVASTLSIGAPTVVETAIVLTRLAGHDQRAVLEAYLHRIDARIIDFTELHYSLATEAFLRFGRGYNPKSRLNFGDCLSYAVAKLAREPLLFVGSDFTHTDIPAA
jgi:ribonuclease VapC